MHSFDLETIGAGLPASALLGQLPPAEAYPRLVVEAPPGTGKTTLVPPLIAEHLRASLSRTGDLGRTAGRVIVTQPRRMAARAAARRLAQLTGTRLGEDVGFTVRGESAVSAGTQIEFVTTGVLLRRLLSHPELSGVSAVILDEVHERQLDTDLTFAMCRELIDLREDLGLVVMSATLDAAQWAQRLGTSADPAPVLSVEAQPHPLDIVWAPPPERALDARGVSRGFLDHVARTTVEALDAAGGSDRAGGSTEAGDVLVFVPGAREVTEAAARITALLDRSEAVTVHTLTGQTPAKEQDAILRPRSASTAGSTEHSAAAERRIIVTTSVAESALTVPGVSIVVDSGLARGPLLDTKRQMSGLVTTRESKASGRQRAGRAARLGPGVAYRCLSEAEWAALPDHTAPEIATSDLTGAVLDLAVWGGDLDLLPDPLPATALRRAVGSLVGLGAVEVNGSTAGSDLSVADLSVTELGRAIARIPASVWAARGLLDGAAMLGPRAAAEAIAVIESDRRAPGADLTALLRDLRSDRRFRSETDRFSRLAAHFGTADSADDDSAAGSPAREGSGAGRGSLRTADLGLVVALAFPHQIARLRSAAHADYLLASGTAASLPRDSSLTGSEWVAIAEVGLAGGRPIIRAAVPIDADTAELAGAGLLTTTETASFDEGRVRAVRQARLGAIELTSTPIPASLELAREAIAASVEERGAREVLRPSATFEQLRGRLGLLRGVLGLPWPDVRWSHLAQNLPQWCPAALDRMARGADPSQVDLIGALRTLLPWPEAARLDELVPTALEVPSGSRITLAYPDPDEADDGDDHPSGPVLAVKLQEVFGWTAVPRVVEGRIPVVLHLLSPAGRPLAVTSDLASFWANAYPHVRAENRGRYPKHPWPEDPLTAPAMRGTKRSGTMGR
ncbi:MULTISPECIES: ATP-dependent helicase HrpB [Brevibacterium]|uniref:ATP-dependent helicase HrpB n=1 Tax=Brevibacterium TaxID=1696 RepID=UPI001BAA85B5|nr:ATP-dependent helicase HrpB [Brevibacterium sp. W7.2]